MPRALKLISFFFLGHGPTYPISDLSGSAITRGNCNSTKMFRDLTYLCTNVNQAIVLFFIPFRMLLLRPSKLSIKLTDDKGILYATQKNKIQTTKIKQNKIQTIQKAPPTPSIRPQLFSTNLREF